MGIHKAHSLMMAYLTIRNLKYLGIFLLVIAAVWFYKDYQYQKSEAERQSHNVDQLIKRDSLNYAKQILTRDELEDYLEYNRQDLVSFLDSQDIKIKRIEKILSQELRYRDSRKQSTDLQPILNAIKENKDALLKVKDSTRCLIIEGYVAIQNDTLSLNITDRQFKNKTDVISYWERNQWSFLGLFKTRLFGRKTATVIIKDDCGKTQTFEIDTKKKN